MPKQMTVVDVVYDNAPQNIREWIKELREVRQNTYSKWDVCSDKDNQEWLKNNDDKYTRGDIEVQNWLKSLGIKEDEEVLILYWW